MAEPFWGRPAPGAGDRADWGREAYVARLLGSAFDLDFEDGEVLTVASSGDEVWRLWLSADGPHRTNVGALDPQRREAFRRAFTDHFERHRVGDEIRAPRRYLLTLGQRR